MLDQDTVKFALTAIVVPGMVLLTFFFATYLALRDEGQADLMVSKKAGLSLGVVLAVGVILLNVYDGWFQPRQSIDASSIGWMIVVAGAVSGFIVIGVVRALKHSSSVSIIIAILASGSLWALYALAAIAEWRTVVMLATIGSLVGSLLYVMLFPRVIKDLTTSAAEAQLAKERARRR